jgi:hypothetical protein
MKLPSIVTNAVLQSLAAPDETHEVHVIIRHIANAAPYTLRGRRRQYIVARDNKRGSHILRVPLSVWMAGCSSEKFVENDSICFDIQSSRTGLKAPLTFEVWPIKKACKGSTAGSSETTPETPPSPEPQAGYDSGNIDAPKPSEPPALTNAQRQAAHRARRKAEKEALQPA